jgi:hypothetical protein
MTPFLKKGTALVFCLEGNYQQKCWFASGMNYFIWLAALVKEICPGGDHSLECKMLEF